MLPGEPFRSGEAKKLIRSIATGGGTVFWTDHAQDKLTKNSLSVVLGQRCLKFGVVGEAEFENGSWRHQVRDPTVTLVVEFTGERELTVVTSWKTER
jgi:hypothetical protein